MTALVDRVLDRVAANSTDRLNLLLIGSITYHGRGLFSFSSENRPVH